MSCAAVSNNVAKELTAQVAIRSLRLRELVRTHLESLLVTLHLSCKLRKKGTKIFLCGITFRKGSQFQSEIRKFIESHKRALFCSKSEQKLTTDKGQSYSFPSHIYFPAIVHIVKLIIGFAKVFKGLLTGMKILLF